MARAAQECTTTRPWKPVFIVGCFRSGTTLLEKLLGFHPQVSSLGFETLLFTHVACGRTLPEFNAGLWAPLLRARFGVDRFEACGIPPLEAVERIIHEVTRSRAAALFVEKTPLHLFCTGPILRRFPDAKIVCIMRDGRDVATSMLHAPFLLPRARRRGMRLFGAAALWELAASQAAALLADPRRERHLRLLRYEDLVQRPRAELCRLFSFLDLDAAAVEGCLERAGLLSSNTSFDSFQGLSTAAMGRWRNSSYLAAAEAGALTALLRRPLQAFGYGELEESRAGRLPLLRARLWRAAWLLERLMAWGGWGGKSSVRARPAAWRALLGKTTWPALPPGPCSPAGSSAAACRDG
jgi:hypothetical protein